MSFTKRDSHTRRDFHKAAATGLLGFLVGGETLFLSPAEAGRRQVPLRVLSPAEARRLSRLGEAIVPGAAAAGLVHYVDHQLADSPERCLLILRYLGAAAPFTSFYRTALAAVAESLTDPSDNALEDYIARLSRENPPGWDAIDAAPPAPFFYFVLRSDAIDVTYGTRAGFDRLDIPYLAHIAPERRSWS